jgi:SpoVK/Ycf46/Vps4 family AAA+-type ATPase
MTKAHQKKIGAAGWAEISWTGEVEIKKYRNLQGELVKIIVKSFLVPGGDGYSFGVLVAADTEIGLAAFMHDLAAYDDSRVDKRKRISIWRGGSLPRPTLTWDDLCVKTSDAKELKGQVESFFNSKDKYAEMKLPYRRGFLLVGPPGNGKTTACKVIASQYPEVFFLIMAVTRQTDDNEFKNALSLASRNGPSVMLIEDLDKLNFDKVPISSFLNMLDGFETKEGVLILATCNEPQLLDKAIAQRPSRFDRVFAFALPDEQQRYQLLKKRSAGRFDDRELKNVAKDCDGMSMAYVQEVVVNALLHAIHAGRDPQNGDLVRSLRALKQQQKNVKNIYDTGVPDKAKGIGFGQDDDDMYDPWDPEREVPGWR